MKTIIIISAIIATLTAYVAIKNRHMPNMSVRQKVLRAFYPIIMMMGKSKKDIVANVEMKEPSQLFSSINILMPDGSLLDKKLLSGKKIIIVNTASDCGYTAQYEALENLYQLYKDKIIIVAIPSNDFMNQEKGNDEAIGAFCSRNYHISFPVAQKGIVLKNEGQLDIYKWLSDERLNGWNYLPPKWNFCKYIIDENGRLTHFLNSTVDPMGKEMREALGLQG